MTAAPNDDLRQRIEAALRTAAFFCGDADCALTEAECVAAHPVQVASWAGDVVSDLYGPIAAIADAVLTVVAAERADALRAAADDLQAMANPDSERGAGVHWAAGRLRDRADGIRPQADRPTATPKESR